MIRKLNKQISLALLLVTLIIAPDMMIFGHEDSAYVRAAHYVAGAPNVDVFVDGKAVLTDFAAASVSDYVELEAGEHKVAIAPTGEGIEKAIIGPVDVTLTAEHRYSLSAIGQTADNSLKSLLIDETAQMAGCDLSKSVFRIIINNIAGLESFSIYENGMYVEKNVKYGEYSAICAPVFFWDTGKAVVGDDLDTILFDFDSEEDGNGGFWEPYNVYFWGLLGKYPGNPGEDYDFGGGVNLSVAPDPVTFLDAFKDKKLTGDSKTYFEFSTLVAALKSTELDKALTEGGPYTIFAPVDAAFATIDNATLDKLMADPLMLADVLKYHVVAGKLSYDDLVAAGKIKTLQGGELTITASEDDGATFKVNGATVMNFPYIDLHGTTVWFIQDQVLMPAK